MASTALQTPNKRGTRSVPGYEDFLRTLAGNIKRARQEADISQYDLAAKIGCEQAAISSWENAQADFSVCRLAQIADALNVSVARLLPTTRVETITGKVHLSDNDITRLAVEIVSKMHLSHEDDFLEAPLRERGSV